MQDGYAEPAFWIYIWVERDRRLKGQRGWHVRVRMGEDEYGAKVASYTWNRSLAWLFLIPTGFSSFFPFLLSLF